MFIKKAIFIILGIIIQIKLFSYPIYITGFNIYPDNIEVTLTKEEQDATRMFYDAACKKDEKGLMNINMLFDLNTSENSIIKSKLDATELCQRKQIKYLLYGFIKKTNQYYDCEIKLYDNEVKDIKKTFYNKSEVGDINIVIDDLADKFIKYMYNMLGFTEDKIDAKKTFGGIGIYNSVGYWFPIAQAWWNVLTGLVSFETGMSVIPVSPYVKVRNFAFYNRFGFMAAYALGINKSGYLKASYNSIILKVPLEFCFEIYKQHVIDIGIAPQLQMDILYQERLYDTAITNFSASFSLGTNLGYEYWIGKEKLTAIGVNNIFNFTFYNNIYVDYRIQLYSVYRIKINLDSHKDTKT